MTLSSLKYLTLLLSICAFFTNGAQKPAKSAQDDLKVVNQVLNNLHEAASLANKVAYLELFTDDGVFMGTDDWERWPRPTALDNYVTERFKAGQGWHYRAIERHINFSADANTAWFDEITESPKWGKFRGTGVLVKQGADWKIAHYAMSFLVPNEVWEQVSTISSEAFKQRPKP